MRASLRWAPLVAAFALLAACAGEGTAARVAGDTIVDTDVEAAAGVFGVVSDLRATPCGTTQGEGDTEEAACNRFSLGALIGFTVAEEYAGSHDLVVSDETVTEAADRFADSLGDGVLEQALEDGGSSYEDFLDVLRGSLLQQAVGDAIVGETVTDDELLAEYEADLAQHVIVQVDHILVPTRAEANEVYDEVTAPGATRDDFLALAEEVSTDPSAAQNRGSLGSTPASQFTEAFQEAVLGMENDEVSRPVKTEFGWHVIHMVDKEVTPFEDVRADLITARSGPAFAERVRTLLEEGGIEVDPRFGRFDPQTLTVVRITSTDPVGTATPSGPVNVAPPEG